MPPAEARGPAPRRTGVVVTVQYGAWAAAAARAGQ